MWNFSSDVLLSYKNLPICVVICFCLIFFVKEHKHLSVYVKQHSTLRKMWDTQSTVSHESNNFFQLLARKQQFSKVSHIFVLSSYVCWLEISIRVTLMQQVHRFKCLQKLAELLLSLDLCLLECCLYLLMLNDAYVL